MVMTRWLTRRWENRRLDMQIAQLGLRKTPLFASMSAQSLPAFV
eukprot:COSAG02_NODE_274_length_26244_cov_36.943507_20_plen_44_part_00